ncbi:MAG: TRAP transporter large permease [Eubacteriales bacterium]
MSVGLIILVTLVLLFTLVLCGVHLSISLMLTSVVTMFLAMGDMGLAIKLLGTTTFSSIREYTFGVIPLFVLMGLFANLSGASTELYDSAGLLLKKVRGGVGIGTIIANAIFAAITGVSIASAAVFTKIAIPQMARLGYDKKFAVGTVAGSSILGMLIPPSILMIVYGSVSEVSIGSLFVAGVIPGLIMTLAFIVVVIVISQAKKGAIPPVVPFTAYEKKNFLKIVTKPWAITVLIFISLGGIWLGYFTPTEAGGIGALGALIIAIIKRKASMKGIWETLLSAGATTGSVLILLVTAQMYSKALALSGALNMIQSYILGLQVPPLVIIFIFMVILVGLGCILDPTSIILLTMPVMVPIVHSFGMSLVWFGIVGIIATETGLLTPPFGISVYTVKSALNGIPEAKDLSVEDIFSGSFPFLLAMFSVLILLVIVPDLVTILLG